MEEVYWIRKCFLLRKSGDYRKYQGLLNWFDQLHTPYPLYTSPDMGSDSVQYQRILTRLKSTKAAVLASSLSLRAGNSIPSITGLGSGNGGQVVTKALCANIMGRRGTSSSCSNLGVLACSQCKLVKYCSERCQRHHWSRHRVHCEHDLRSSKWRPQWVTERRAPKFRLDSKSNPRDSYPLWSSTPAFDCLGLGQKFSTDDLHRNLKICYPDVRSLSQLVSTINSLPRGFEGQCDILLNHTDSVIVNRHLIILHALLRSGRDIEETAELATHLIYSAFLTPPSAEYLKTCVDEIYGVGPREGDMSFFSTLETRGLGNLRTMQTTMGIKRPVEMASSTYGLTKARRGFHDALLHLLHLDDRERHLMKLKPAHRLALSRFWETGVLSPVFLNTASFNQPNRLHFSPQGEWVGQTADVNPLQGWDIASVQKSGTDHGLDTSDILGCLFFHVKSELAKFARRLQDICVNIYFTQFDVRVLSTGICSGLLPAFEANCFDRIDAGELMDVIGVRECLSSLAPLVNSESPGACILMHSRAWHYQMPSAIARGNPRLMHILMSKAKDLPALEYRLKKADVTEVVETDGKPITSTSLLRMIDFLDAFVDHEASFQAYLEEQDLKSICETVGFKMRHHNQHYPKRSGIGMDYGDSPELKAKRLAHVPGLHLTKEEFYDLFILGGAELPTRFIEFEPKGDSVDLDDNVYIPVDRRRFSM
ncbi:hypothetical protein NP233_g5353 [Leucocoprinus birnbaumii]|uniref:MYND-type domain-containing protein n=1 Tax=Leucocoprinus birnbaumii TaxID=56174 RepID=A0AAD5YWI6_9AGAR|nr:hypothetical protein NP233_g5353 [Leucocoprinus birnbaumii]